MEEDILNYSPTVMFRGTPCNSKPKSQHVFRKSKIILQARIIKNLALKCAKFESF